VAAGEVLEHHGAAGAYEKMKGKQKAKVPRGKGFVCVLCVPVFPQVFVCVYTCVYSCGCMLLCHPSRLYLCMYQARHPSSSSGYGRWSGCEPQPQLKRTQACICGRHQAPVLLEIPVELHPLVVRSSSVQPFLSSLYTPFTIMLSKWWVVLLEVLQALPQTEQTNMTCNLRVRKKPQACNSMPLPLSSSQVLSSLQPGLSLLLSLPPFLLTPQ